MRTLALSLAAALLGTGCIVTSNDPVGEVAIFWRFQDSQGELAGNFTAADNGCDVAGVTDVDVEIFDGPNRIVFQTFPCAQAATGLPRAVVGGLETGTYDWVITAYRLNDAVFADAGAFVIREDAVTEVPATAGVLLTAPLTLYYQLNGQFTCAGVSTIYFAVYNAAGTVLLDSGEVPCDPVSNGFSLAPLPSGIDYLVDFFQALDRPLGAGGIAEYELCGFLVRNTGFPATVNLQPAPHFSCG